MAGVSETRASLRIFGDDLDPDEITRLLGAQPERARRKGEPVNPSSRDPVPSRTGMWRLRAAPRLPGNLDAQVGELTGALSGDLSVWAGIGARFRVDLFCGVFMAEGNEGISLSRASMALLADRGIEIGLDIYGPVFDLEMYAPTGDDAARPGPAGGQTDAERRRTGMNGRPGTSRMQTCNGPLVVLPRAEGREALCRAVLADLPDWFGIPAAMEEYVGAAGHLPMLEARIGERAVGFVSLRATSPAAWEIHVIGVLRRFHRRGAGRALVEAAAAAARAGGARFLTVKTLAPEHADAGYAATRRFYEAMGFLPLETFPDLWGPADPCLLMLRPLA